MTTPTPDSKARIVAPTYDKRGNPQWQLRMSPPDDSFAMCLMVPDRIVPVIFVPGVMGSNLVEASAEPDKAVKWRLDGALSAGEWALPTKDAKFRKQYLQPQVMRVDDGGFITSGTAQDDEELKRRGWGEVGAISYGEWLVWLENALNDFDNPHNGERAKLMSDALQALVGEELLARDEVGLSYKYRFPVYACGYNWLASNADSAKLLGDRIDAVIKRYTNEKKRCEKVIIVTHSMGGLVARHCSEVGGYRDKILGIVHGVMPAIGAAAVYRRFKAGTEDTTGWYNAVGAATASALGNDAGEMTAVLSGSPGPLQLLPTPEYGNGWLKIKDNHKEVRLPAKGDPYSEIYTVRGQWWSMCEDTLINPLNEEQDPKKKQVQVDRDWAAFADVIKNTVKPFHKKIKDQYHPNTHAFFGSHKDHLSYGTVGWTSSSGRVYQSPSDFMSGTLLEEGQVNDSRRIEVQAAMSRSARGAAPLPGALHAEQRRFTISAPDEAGDGTVPHRSGVAPQAACKSFMQANVEHEPAYKYGDGAENLRACRYTLRCIVKIAQDIKNIPRMKYD